MISDEKAYYLILASTKMTCQPRRENLTAFSILSVLLRKTLLSNFFYGVKYMLSVIIPTLNEERELPSLLKSIKKQGFKNYEIIVADAGSKDRTLEIAKKHGAKLIKGGSPSYGRNQGAKLAKNNLLLFLDADVLLPESFLEKSLKEFQKRKLDIASFQLLPRESMVAGILFNLFYNFPAISLEKILPHAAMGILIEKELFFKLNGFDESIKLAEDHDLARRAKKISSFGIMRGAKLLVSIRRFQKEGWFKTALKYFLCELHMLFLGPVKTDVFSYKFNHYSSKNKK